MIFLLVMGYLCYFLPLNSVLISLSSPAIYENIKVSIRCWQGEECKFLRTELPTKLSWISPILLLPANKLLSLMSMLGCTVWCLLFLEAMLTQELFLVHGAMCISSVGPATWDHFESRVLICPCEECKFPWCHPPYKIMFQSIIQWQIAWFNWCRLAMHLCVLNCNGIPTTSGSNVDSHGLCNIGYQVAFHDLSCHLWPC